LESEAQIDIVSRELDRQGVAWRDLDRNECRAMLIKRCVRMTEPVTGAMLDFYAGMAQMDTPHSPTVAKIQHLSHVVLGTPGYRSNMDTAWNCFRKSVRARRGSLQPSPNRSIPRAHAAMREWPRTARSKP